MPEIKRCPACLTYVYANARRCHGCGERTGRRRILTRGSWIFIVLAVTGFAIGRGIDLQQERRDKARREIETAEMTELTKAFVNSWLTGDTATLDRSIVKRDAFQDKLGRLRSRYSTVLPATEVTDVEVTPAGRQTYWTDQPTTVIARKASRFYSSAPTFDFHARILKGTEAFSVAGFVCIEDHSVFCVGLRQVNDRAGNLVNPVGN